MNHFTESGHKSGLIDSFTLNWSSFQVQLTDSIIWLTIHRWRRLSVNDRSVSHSSRVTPEDLENSAQVKQTTFYYTFTVLLLSFLKLESFSSHSLKLQPAHYSKLLLFLFNRRQCQVWNEMRVSKWWQNHFFCELLNLNNKCSSSFKWLVKYNDNHFLVVLFANIKVLLRWWTC